MPTIVRWRGTFGGCFFRIGNVDIGYLGKRRLRDIIVPYEEITNSLGLYRSKPSPPILARLSRLVYSCHFVLLCFFSAHRRTRLRRQAKGALFEFYNVATLADILSPVWTLSIAGLGAIVEGLDAIKQNLSLIIRTTPGTDPLRPEFGCGLYRYVDQPLNAAIPNMKKALLDGISRWETRVTVTKITDSLGDSGQVIFNIGYSLADGVLSDSLTVSAGAGGVITGVSEQRLILRALLPTSGTGLQFQISGQINGANILPAPLDGGFSTIAALFSWVQTNWLNYGQWYLTADSIVGYLNVGYTSGSLSVSLLSVRQVIQNIPAGTNYTVSVSVDGAIYSNTGLQTVGDVLGYVQSDPVLGELGGWTVISVAGDFGGDFGDDFETFFQALQLITGLEDEIQITITAN
jgi:phage baseplate assembly protein W